MKFFSTKNIYTDLKEEELEGVKKFSEEKKVKLRKIQLELLSYILKFCDENEIDIMAGGGTLLGAVRHQGFIPWDDDIDLMMLREDFEKLLSLQNKILNKYELQYCKTKFPSYVGFAKFISKEHVLVEIGSENIPKKNGVFLDIFIIENIPNNKLLYYIHGLRCEYLRLVATSLVYCKFFSKYEKKIVTIKFKAKLNYILRRTIAFFYNYKTADINGYFIKLDLLTSKYKEYSGKNVTIPTGRGHYFGEKILKDIFLKKIEVKFENLIIKIPEKYDVYLRNLYGEKYMELPPLHKREKHNYIYFE